jgi:monoamine oxidase
MRMSRNDTLPVDATGTYDVIVVGAGLSGLATALELLDLGHRVLVLEADSRVGGRTETGTFSDGQWIELGGQWVSSEHRELRRLISRFGLATTPTYSNGNVVSLHRGVRYVGSSPPLPSVARTDVDSALERLSAMVNSVDLDAPWRTPDAPRLDRQTFDSWIRDELQTEDGREYFRTACDALFAPDPVEVSTLHAAVYLKSGGHLRRLRGIDRDSQEERVVGGAASISERVAAYLSHRVRLDSPVRSIAQTADAVAVTTRSGEVFRAARVIVTLPPPLAARLEYSPPMPSERDQLTQRLHAISVTKLHLVYARPFWREQKLSGEGVSDVGPVRVVLDNTPPDYARGVLVGFIEGADKHEWLRSPAGRRSAFLDAAVRMFGPEAQHPLEYLERDWASQEFTRGCYHGHFAPSTWTTYGSALTEPVGRIHWGGTETSREWTGYMEGAVRSGIRVAHEVADRLT